MRPQTKSRRSIVPQAVLLAAALSLATRAETTSPPIPVEPTMPAAPEDVKAPPADSVKTASGLASKVLTAGKGTVKPGPTDTVSVHYTGWTTDGKMFDSSVQRGQPASFPLNGVIKGWTEGLQLMVEGEKRRFWIPAELAYGEKPEGGRPGGMLVFDVELLDIKELAKIPDDVEKTAGGVAYQVVTKGDGSSPTGTDVMTLHMSVATMDGQTLQDTRQGPQPPSVPLDKMPPALAEILGAMKPGEKRRCWLPEPNAPGAHVVAEVELISFKQAPPPPPVPEDVAAVPEGAEKTASGLASKVLKAGEGKDKPAATDTVKVHYSGWTTDGKMFDSSVTRGEPAQFPLNGVIKGWTEGLQLMVVGEKRRFWIPADLGYGENPGGGRPGGMLVFDVELLEIVK